MKKILYLLLFVSVSCSAQLTTGLVAYYKMDANFNDTLGVHNGTNGYVAATGKIRNGCVYTGAASATLIADHADWTMGSGDFTVSAWIKRTNVTGTQLEVLGQMNSAGATSSISFEWEFQTDNTLICIFGTSSFKFVKSTTVFSNTTNWYHVAQVRRGNFLYIYVNGIQEASLDITGLSMNDSSTHMSIGRGGDYTVTGAQATIDEIGIWKGVGLTDAQITQLYQSNNGLQYPFANRSNFFLMFN